jgi:hypothetical protein
VIVELSYRILCHFSFKGQAFEFLSNIENLPKWSTQFVKKIIKADGKFKAITPIGEVFIRFEVDQKTGPLTSMQDR